MNRQKIARELLAVARELTARRREKAIRVDWNDPRSVREAEHLKRRLEDDGYELVQTVGGFTTSELIYEKVARELLKAARELTAGDADKLIADTKKRLSQRSPEMWKRFHALQMGTVNLRAIKKAIGDDNDIANKTIDEMIRFNQRHSKAIADELKDVGRSVDSAIEMLDNDLNRLQRVLENEGLM
jgi:gas vesicle protein